MADLIDVLNAVNGLALSTLYPPSGVIPGNSLSPISGCAVETINGMPGADDLDAVAASLGSGTPRVIVSIMTPPGMARNTTRYPQEWQRQIAGTTTLSVSIDSTGTMATISGAVAGSSGSAQNIALILGYSNSPPVPFAYSVLPTDTLNSIAAALAALVNAVTPATSSGPTVTIPGAHFLLVGRVGGVSTALKEVMRQIERVHVDTWAPAGLPSSPQLRDLVAAPLKLAFAETPRMLLADQTLARVITTGDYLLDDPEKAGLYRRCLAYDIEYPTTVTMPAPIVIAAEAVPFQTGTLPLGSPPVGQQPNYGTVAIGPANRPGITIGGYTITTDVNNDLIIINPDGTTEPLVTNK